MKNDKSDIINFFYKFLIFRSGWVRINSLISTLFKIEAKHFNFLRFLSNFTCAFQPTPVAVMFFKVEIIILNLSNKIFNHVSLFAP